jgi:hypothetical protein
MRRFDLGRKILQLDDRTRVKFKVKLGFTYLRLNDEERELALENPWTTPAPPQPRPNDPTL